MGNEKECCKVAACPCGWLAKRVLGLPLCTWVLLFAILPFTARGISWTARGLTGLRDGGARVVGVERTEDARYNGRSNMDSMRLERRMRSNDMRSNTEVN